MTEDELKQIEDREKAATKGPWRYEIRGEGEEYQIVAIRCPHATEHEDDEIAEVTYSDGDDDDDARSDHSEWWKEFNKRKFDFKFMAEARQDIPALLTEVRFLKNQNRELAAGTEILLIELERVRKDNARLANENAALVAQIPNGFTFPREGEAAMIE
jgi:hypothetical protein